MKKCDGIQNFYNHVVIFGGSTPHIEAHGLKCVLRVGLETQTQNVMYRLPDTKTPLIFPDDFETTEEGLLAIGGNLHPDTLIDAYSQGIFPWFSHNDPILWWHPDPRSVLWPEELHLSRKICRAIKNTSLNHDRYVLPNDKKITHIVTINHDFEGVIGNCATKKRRGQRGTWITTEMKKAYIDLHYIGYAHSVEVWNREQELVGGMYGVAMGKIFFGESMFSHEDNTSKFAIYWLCQVLIKNKFILLDCQVESNHINSLGAKSISRDLFLKSLKEGRTFAKEPAQCFKVAPQTGVADPVMS